MPHNPCLNNRDFKSDLHLPHSAPSPARTHAFSTPPRLYIDNYRFNFFQFLIISFKLAIKFSISLIVSTETALKRSRSFLSWNLLCLSNSSKIINLSHVGCEAWMLWIAWCSSKRFSKFLLKIDSISSNVGTSNFPAKILSMEFFTTCRAQAIGSDGYITFSNECEFCCIGCMAFNKSFLKCSVLAKFFGPNSPNK